MEYAVILNQYSNLFHAKIIGKLLGDGTITKQVGRKSRFQFSHVATDKDWITYCFQQLNTNCPLCNPIYRKIIDHRIRKGFSEAYIVQSRTSPIFDILEELWYSNRKKILPIDYINEYFDEVSLAWWYQDDGSLKQENNFPRKVILSTECFTLQEIKYLQMLLKTKFQLQFSIDKQKRLVLYDANSIFYFLSLIEQYIQPAMIRKTISTRHFQLPITSPKRSTIYLPAELMINAPTIEINEVLVNLETLWNSYKNGFFYNTVYLPNIMRIQSKPLTQSYQIVIRQKPLHLLHILKMNTGLTYSQLASLCFIVSTKKIALDI